MKKQLKHFYILISVSLFILIGLLAKHFLFSYELPSSKKDIQIHVKSLDNLIEDMTLEEKVGQMFLSRTPEYNQIEDIQTYHLGGYILFGRDMEDQTLESLQTTIASYQKISDIPLIIASDEEGGTVTRISSLLDEPFRSPHDIFDSDRMDGIISDTVEKISILENVGILAGLFPVADFATDEEAFIYNRTLGQDLETTTDYISTIVATMSEYQFTSTLKHFPGYGNNGDSHSDIIEDDRSLEELEETDFKVFQAGIEAGADSILVSHNIMTTIDDVPSSISPTIISILRDNLHFEGVIMTDDMDMEGLSQFAESQEEAAYLAIQAGEDMILSSSYAQQIPYIIEKVESGELSEERINESVKRILTWKEKLGLIKM